ncbi:MAG: arsenic resistance N-acetyltransferase ArsN2 [Bacteroidota bacterium]
MKIEPLIKSDIEKVKTLLVENNLPVNDIDKIAVQLFVVKAKNKIIGVIGIENYSTIGLLRSLAVSDNYKNLKIGAELVDYIIGYCSTNKMQELYLLTTTAEKYFVKFGFNIMERENIPDLIKKTSQFADICPASAIIMKKHLNKD